MCRFRGAFWRCCESTNRLQAMATEEWARSERRCCSARSQSSSGHPPWQPRASQYEKARAAISSRVGSGSTEVKAFVEESIEAGISADLVARLERVVAARRGAVPLGESMRSLSDVVFLGIFRLILVHLRAIRP